MRNPWTDVLEWWDEDHWLHSNLFEEFLTAKFSFPAIVHRASDYAREYGILIDTGKMAKDAIEELFPEKGRSDNGVGILWAFNNCPETSFQDIQTVLICCAEAWRQEVGTAT